MVRIQEQKTVKFVYGIFFHFLIISFAQPRSRLYKT